MGYYDTPKKPIKVLNGKSGNYASHDTLIDRAGDAGKYGCRSDAAADGVGYLGVDDLNRLRREKLKHSTK